MPVEHLAGLHAAADAAADVVRAMPRQTRWFLHCDTDADGLAAAAVTALALTRIGHRFHIRASRDKTGDAYAVALREQADGHIFLDKGTSHVGDLGASRDGRPVLVLDHHNVPVDAEAATRAGVTLLNPRAVGLDGSNDASSASTAVAFAQSLIGDAALDWAGIGLIGAIGDWQHMGGWDGWNRRLVDLGVERSVLAHRHRPAFVGMDLAQAVAHRSDLELPGLTGDVDAARGLLQRLRVPVEEDSESIEDETATAFVTGLALHALAQGVPAKALRHLTTPMLYDARLGGLRHAFRLADACGREGHADVGVAFLVGDEGAREEAARLFAGYRDAIASNLQRLRDEGPKQHRHFQSFGISAPAYTGMVSGLGMTVVLADKSKPIVVHAPRPDGDVQVSARGLEPHVRAGLDLGAAMGAAARRVGREGGGHPIAAGSVVPSGRLTEFLAALDEVLGPMGPPAPPVQPVPPEDA